MDSPKFKMIWYSKDAEAKMKEFVKERIELDKLLVEQYQRGMYTGPLGPTTPDEIKDQLLNKT